MLQGFLQFLFLVYLGILCVTMVTLFTDEISCYQPDANPYSGQCSPKVVEKDKMLSFHSSLWGL